MCLHPVHIYCVKANEKRFHFSDWPFIRTSAKLGNMSTNEGDIVEQKIKIISSSKKSCKTYEFTDEDHTLGNSLRYALMRK